MKKSKAIAPAKLILSGEHAAVYGYPALAVAINRFAETTVSSRSTRSILFDLPDLSHTKSFTLGALREVKRRLKSGYKKFSKGELEFSQILESPFDLAHFVFINTIDRIKLRLAGLNIKTESHIPTGCGLGSSAAMTLSMTAAVTAYYGIELNREQYFKLGQEAEKLQHGYPSGLDIQTILDGRCVYFKNYKTIAQSIPTWQFCLVNTGMPTVSTGDSVSDVRKHFGKSTIWESFADVTNALQVKMSENVSIMSMSELIQENQRLLETIGVVPDRVQQFVREIETQEMVAKVCGAGAVRGDNAGVVLVLTENRAALESICESYRYPIEEVEVSQHGLQIL